jgi:hypothetical protein
MDVVRNKFYETDAKIKSTLEANIGRTFTTQEMEEMDARIQKYLNLGSNELHVPWLFTKNDMNFNKND